MQSRFGKVVKISRMHFRHLFHVSPQPTNNKYLNTPRLLSFLKFLTHRLVDFTSIFRQNSFRNKFHGKAHKPNGISNLRFPCDKLTSHLCVFSGPTVQPNFSIFVKYMRELVFSGWIYRSRPGGTLWPLPLTRYNVQMYKCTWYSLLLTW